MIASLLLAAGASRRFGGAKLLVPLEGKPIVRWSAEAATAAPVSETIVVTGTDDSGIRGALAGLPLRLVRNEDGGGMGTSIAAGVAALGEEVTAVLVALADQPHPSVAARRAVLERFAAGGAAIIAPRYRGVPGHPVLFARATFGELRALRGERGARAVLERDPRRAAIVEVDEDAPIDIDTPADVARAAAWTNGRGLP